MMPAFTGTLDGTNCGQYGIFVIDWCITRCCALKKPLWTICGRSWGRSYNINNNYFIILIYSNNI